jgi:hypothetical protein
MKDMTYEEVVTALLEQIPELQEDYDAECANWVPDKPHPHVVYGSVLPTLIYRIETAWRATRLPEDEELLHRIFSHVENLAASSDFETRCVIEASLLETLLGKVGGYDRFLRFFRPNTAIMAQSVAERFSGE